MDCDQVCESTLYNHQTNIEGYVTLYNVHKKPEKY